MDKASPHYRSKKVIDYLEQNKDTLIPVYLPTASPEFMMLEQVWNIAKRELLVLQHYSSFDDFKQKISCYLRTKKVWSEYEKLSVEDCLGIYVKWYMNPRLWRGEWDSKPCLSDGGSIINTDNLLRFNY